jgi:hypothetical protein
LGKSQILTPYSYQQLAQFAPTKVAQFAPLRVDRFEAIFPLGPKSGT